MNKLKRVYTTRSIHRYYFIAKMARMAGIDGLRLKLLGILVAFALIPMVSMGIISLMEMNQASLDVQNNISSLSTSLNRSALTVAPNDADQMQLAIAKARQYDEFFKRIASENKLVAGYAGMNLDNESCTSPPGIWVAPLGLNQTTSEKRSATIRSLCAPARIMQSLLQAEPSLSLSYIGTEDGVLLTWPYGNETVRNTAPFGYKDMPYYAAAKGQKRAIWTGPYVNGNGQPAITITTPIYRDSEFTGIAGMDVSLESIYKDLSSMKGRGYPFLIDGKGSVVSRPGAKPGDALKSLFESENLSEGSSPEVRRLAKEMLKGDSGSIVIGLGEADGYVAYSPITTVGWSLGIAYPAEEMSLPARFIDSGIKDVAKSATQGLNDAYRKTQEYALIILALTASIVLASGYLLSRRFGRGMRSFSSALEKIARGEFDVEVKSTGELAPLGTAFNDMIQGLKNYTVEREREAFLRGSSGKESAFLRSIKSKLVPTAIPEKDGYEILALYLPSEKNGFDLYDIAEADGRIVLAMAGVGGDGFQAAMLAVMSRTLILAMPDKSDPSRVIFELNSQINQHAQGMNLACFYALLDPVNHTLEYVNAGFNPPFIVDSGGMVDTLGGGGIALGMLDKIELPKERIPIQPGDVMVMYSNGVVEREDIYKKQFGIEKLINLIIEHRTRPAAQIQKEVERALAEFSKDQPAQADIALVILKRILKK
ncbi:Stage II sporulation protein E (SpoIIE) [uncultured archaeon]|nr:Stage II sporulation protein E (SpoIIE) [uncultured archaeon]